MLLQGFSVSLEPNNFAACIWGILLGAFVGVVPSMGSAGALALLMPFCYSLDAPATVIMLTSIYYGSKYGGAATSIFLNIPGEPSSLATCTEGYAMTRRGRGGSALMVALLGSFVASVLGLVGVVLLAPAMEAFVISLGPPEYFILLLIGLAVLARIVSDSLLKSLLLINIGIALSTIGMDNLYGVTRFTLRIPRLAEGIDICLLVMGVFGISRVLIVMTSLASNNKICSVSRTGMFPSRRELRRSVAPVMRGSLLGFIIGLLPCPSEIVASFGSYIWERQQSLMPKRFGRGMIEGVAGPEAAKNSAVSACLIPLLLMGLPFSAGLAMLLSGFMIKGISPGIMLIEQSYGGLFWIIIASLFIANVLLLILGVPLAWLFMQALRLRLGILMPLILVLILTSVFAIKGSVIDVCIVMAFGLIGFYLEITGYQAAPLLVGFVLGPEIEQQMVQSLIICDGSIANIVSRPLTLVIWFSACLCFILRTYYHQKIGWDNIDRNRMKKGKVA